MEQVKAAALEKVRTKKMKITNEDLAEAPEEPSGSQVGIKDIKEVIIFTFALAEMTVEVLEDGLGLLDVLDVFRADEVRQEFGPAVRGAGDIPREVADLSSKEMKILADLIWEESWELWNTISG